MDYDQPREVATGFGRSLEILLEIMQWMDRPTLLNVMLTCRALHANGLRLLLVPQVSIEESKQLRSFCRFISAGSSRWQYLQSLHLKWDTSLFPPDASAMAIEKAILLQVARNATSLKRLFIEGWRPIPIPLYDETFFGSLRNLVELRLQYDYSVDLGAVQLLSSLKCPLRVVSLKFPVSGRRIVDFIEVMAPFRETLEELHADSVVSTRRDPEIIFPKMKDLSLAHFNDWDGPFLMKTFPNLQHLRYEAYDESGIRQIPDLYDTSFEQLTIARLENLHNQLRTGCAWPSMLSVSGPIAWVYAMAIACPINKLSLTAETISDGLYPVYHAECYPSIMASAQPSVLYVRLLSEDDSFEHDIAQLFA
ncbi:hypothetical protein BDW22DRAFT_567036 [Trametopsis cervina]|nr:hypothetical protein BDW22DRAFT_567036 [Trametopsis cervina]